MFNLFGNRREELREAHNTWNTTYEEKDVTENERAKECSKNHKAVTGMTSNEIKESRNTNNTHDALDTKETERMINLESKQITEVSKSNNRNEALEKSEEVRQNKGWWW